MEWIKFAETMPKPGQLCLLRTDKGYISIYRYTPNDERVWSYDEGNKIDFGCGCCSDQIEKGEDVEWIPLSE